MFSKKEILSSLLGCFEVFLFMGQSIERFSDTRGGAIRSFAVPLILLPFSLSILVLKPSEYPAELIVSIHGIRFLISLTLTLTAVYFISKGLGRHERFYAFVSASNWISVISFVLLLPCIAFLVQHPGEWEPMRSYAIFITIYSYVLLAYVAKLALRLNWYLGGFIAIVCLGIDQTLLDIANIIRDNLV